MNKHIAETWVRGDFKKVVVLGGGAQYKVANPPAPELWSKFADFFFTLAWVRRVKPKEKHVAEAGNGLSQKSQVKQ